MNPDGDLIRKRIEDRRRELGVDAILIQDPADLRWATGFTGSSGLLLWSADDRHFLTDGRYRDQARSEVWSADVHVPGYDLIGHLRDAGLAADLARVAFDSTTTTVAGLTRLRESLPRIEWVDAPGLLSSARSRKTPREVDAIRRAQALSEAVLMDVVRLIRPGLTTEREVAGEITGRCLRAGADAMAFDPIVAAGDRSALPHARATDRVIAPGDPLLVDFGCTFEGYASDMTRMLSAGPPSVELVRLHAIVVSAIEAAETVARADVPAKDVDAAARRVIGEAGLGDRFPHSLGHGVGLAVHESPTLSARSVESLPDGCVVTLEPGIYLPGAFGVRVEDLVHVSTRGTEPLTSVARDLIIF